MFQWITVQLIIIVIGWNKWIKFQYYENFNVGITNHIIFKMCPPWIALLAIDFKASLEHNNNALAWMLKFASNVSAVASINVVNKNFNFCYFSQNKIKSSVFMKLQQIVQGQKFDQHTKYSY